MCCSVVTADNCGGPLGGADIEGAAVQDAHTGSRTWDSPRRFSESPWKNPASWTIYSAGQAAGFANRGAVPEKMAQLMVSGEAVWMYLYESASAAAPREVH